MRFEQRPEKNTPKQIKDWQGLFCVCLFYLVYFLTQCLTELLNRYLLNEYEWSPCSFHYTMLDLEKGAKFSINVIINAFLPLCKLERQGFSYYFHTLKCTDWLVEDFAGCWRERT